MRSPCGEQRPRWAFFFSSATSVTSFFALRLAFKLRWNGVKGRSTGTDQTPSSIATKLCNSASLRVPLSRPNKREQMMSNVRFFMRGSTSSPKFPTFSHSMDTDGNQGDALGDIFGATLSLEEAHKEEGYREGFAEGVAAGREEARQLGLQHGFVVGEELGFYRGCADVWAAAIRVDPAAFSARVQRGIGLMGELLDRYPLLDPEDESTQEALEAIRLRFRAITASLGVRLDYNGQPKSRDAASGTEF